MPGILTEKINAIVGKKSFRRKFKVSNCMSSSHYEPNKLKLGMWGFYHQRNNLGG